MLSEIQVAFGLSCPGQITSHECDELFVHLKGEKGYHASFSCVAGENLAGIANSKTNYNTLNTFTAVENANAAPWSLFFCNVIETDIPLCQPKNKREQHQIEKLRLSSDTNISYRNASFSSSFNTSCWLFSFATSIGVFPSRFWRVL